MIRKNKHFLLLILSGIFFLLSYYSFKYFSGESQYQIDTKIIENRISKLDDELDLMLETYKSQLQNKIDTVKYGKKSEFI